MASPAIAPALHTSSPRSRAPGSNRPPFVDQLHMSLFECRHRPPPPGLTKNSLTRFYLELGKTLSELRLAPSVPTPPSKHYTSPGLASSPCPSPPPNSWSQVESICRRVFLSDPCALSQLREILQRA